MIPVKCKLCHKEFFTYPCYLKTGRGIYCSRKCQFKMRSKLFRNRIKRKCKICGKKFEAIPSKIKGGGGKYCSRKCFLKWYSQNLKGENSPLYKKPIKLICPVCKKSFLVKNGMVNPKNIKTKRKFCSLKCAYKGRISFKKEKSHYWKGGKREKICLLCKKKFLSFPSQSRKFCSQRCSTLYKNKTQKTEDTKIEKLIEQEFIKNSIPYMKQVPLEGIALVDFLLPNRIIVQCDGDYWHNLSKVKIRDKRQDYILNSNGYKIFRFKEKEILNNPEKCLQKIIQ